MITPRGPTTSIQNSSALAQKKAATATTTVFTNSFGLLVEATHVTSTKKEEQDTGIAKETAIANTNGKVAIGK